MLQNLIFATFFLIALVLVIPFKRTSYVQETTPRIRGLGIESKIPDRREYDQDEDEDEVMTSPHIEYNYSDEDKVNVANDLQKALIPISAPPGADGTMNFGYNLFLGSKFSAIALLFVSFLYKSLLNISMYSQRKSMIQ